MKTDSLTDSREPRFNPMWWWVIGAFLLLIGAWATLIFLARSHEPERLEVPVGQTSCMHRMAQ